MGMHRTVLSKVCAEKKGFQNIASFTLSKRVSAFKKKQIEIATSLNDMMTVDELITAYYFMNGVWTSFWDPNYIMFKYTESITNNSGRMARNMPITTCIIWKEMKNVKVIMENSPYLKPSVIEKDIHVSDNDSHEFLHGNLPRRAMNEITNAHDNHFKK